MSNGGKAKTRSGKKRKGRAKAAAADAPRPDSAPAPATAEPEIVADEPAAPVGFTARDAARDGGGDAKPGPAAKKSGGAGVAVFFVAVVAVVAVAGYLTRATWLPGAGPGAEKSDAPAPDLARVADQPAPAQPSPPAPDESAPAAADAAALEALAREREQLHAELNRLMARLDGIEKSMDTAKQMIRATAPPADKIAGGPSLEQLSERVGALEKQEAALTELRQRVEKMEHDSAAGDGGARAIVLAVAGLGDAISRGEPYQRHLETLKAVSEGDPNIKAAAALLAKGAADGIPTLGALRARFDGLAGRIVGAAKARDDDGWMARAANRISSLITWRRVGDAAAGDSVDAAVARAEARLKSGDLAGAVKALDGLAAVNGKSAAAAEPWIADAKARITAERAVASLHVHAVSLLAPAKP